MKNVFFLLTLFFTTHTFAADLIVEEFGVAPAYNSIQSALNAASNGDRILIKNRTTAVAWFENLTIDKSIELLSYDNDSSFTMQGNIVITPSYGRVITIVGMNNLNGYINHINTSTSSKGVTINIIDCKINRYVNLDHESLVVNFIGNTLRRGVLELIHGKVIGNNFNRGQVYIRNSNTAYPTEDLLIVGNRIVFGSASPLYVAIGTYNLQIKNNFIHSVDGSSAISLHSGYNSNLGHKIYNNTIKVDSLSTNNASGIFITSNYSVVEIVNNVLDTEGSTASNGITLHGNFNSNINIYNNFIDGDFSVAIAGTPAVNVNNNTTSTFTIPTTGILPAGHPGINGGNPAPEFYDLDLSVGDAGCFGGSFTLDNFFPLHTGAARVYMVNYPFNVRQGSTLRIDADSYDR